MGHLRTKGFKVTTVDVSNAKLKSLKDEHGVPRNIRSCHTGLLGDYVVEGHVPGDVISKLLKERPAVAGVSVPGMPIGSPGMEGPNPQPYRVYTFTKRGPVRIYQEVQP